MILKVIDVAEAVVEKAQADGAWDFDAMERCVEFFRLFADACHHGKEEDLLFPELEARGLPRDSGPIAVMLFEHRQGRELVRRMAEAMEGARDGDESALKTLTNAARGYIELLRNHIFKEDNALFNMADQMVDAPACRRLCDQYDVVCARHFEGRTKEQLETLAGQLQKEYGKPAG